MQSENLTSAFPASTHGAVRSSVTDNCDLLLLMEGVGMAGEFTAGRFVCSSNTEAPERLTD